MADLFPIYNKLEITGKVMTCPLNSDSGKMSERRRSTILLRNLPLQVIFMSALEHLWRCAAPSSCKRWHARWRRRRQGFKKKKKCSTGPSFETLTHPHRPLRPSQDPHLLSLPWPCQSLKKKKKKLPLSTYKLLLERGPQACREVFPLQCTKKCQLSRKKLAFGFAPKSLQTVRSALNLTLLGWNNVVYNLQRAHASNANQKERK